MNPVAFGSEKTILDNPVDVPDRDKVIKIIPNFKFVNCIHPKSILGKDATLGDGNVVMAGAIINSSTRINNHCIINTNSSLDHDCLMSDFSSIAPNAAVGGNVKIGNYSAIGIGANIFDGVNIGYNCIIGGGSLVCHDTNANSIYYGSPSKFIREFDLELNIVSSSNSNFFLLFKPPNK